MSDPVSTLDRATAQAGQTIRIEDRGPVGQITLRGDLSSPALQAAVTKATGMGVPEPLMAAFDEDTGAIWMSPDELLLFTEYTQADALVAALGKTLAGQHHMAVNVSNARAVITLSGPGVAEVVDDLLARVRAFAAGAPQSDDITLLALRRKDAPA